MLLAFCIFDVCVCGWVELSLVAGRTLWTNGLLYSDDEERIDAKMIVTFFCSKQSSSANSRVRDGLIGRKGRQEA